MEAVYCGVNSKGVKYIQRYLDKVYSGVDVSLKEISKEEVERYAHLLHQRGGEFTYALFVLDESSYKVAESLVKSEGKSVSANMILYDGVQSIVDFSATKGVELKVDDEDNAVQLQESAQGDIQELNSTIKYYESRIESLNAQIKELQERILDYESNESLDAFDIDIDYVEELKQKLSNAEDKIAELQEQLENSSSTEDLNRVKEELEKVMARSVEKDSRLRSVMSELDTLRVKNTSDISFAEQQISEQSGKILSLEQELVQKDSQINELSGLLGNYTEDKDRIGVLEEEKKDLLSQLSSVKSSYNDTLSVVKEKENQISALSISVSNKDKELSCKEDTINLLKGKLVSLKESSESYTASLSKELEKTKVEVSKLQGKINSLEAELSASSSYKEELYIVERKLKKQEELEGELRSNLQKELQSKQDLEKTIESLNKTKIAQKEKIDMLEKSVNRNTDVEEIEEQVAYLRSELSKLKNNVFHKLANYGGMSDKFNLRLVSNTKYKNIRYAFAGSCVSRKGMYKTLHSEVSNIPSDQKVLILDVVTETSIDYVFGIEDLKCGSKWFVSGGDLTGFLSDTSMDNVKVLSFSGTDYVNDLAFLSIKWETRMQELHYSEYFVIVCFGDISNPIGRIFHESFASKGDSCIYTQGSLTSSRSLLMNLGGLSNAKESGVVIFDYNIKNKKFIQIMNSVSKICKIRLVEV